MYDFGRWIGSVDQVLDCEMNHPVPGPHIGVQTDVALNRGSPVVTYFGVFWEDVVYQALVAGPQGPAAPTHS